MSVFARPEAWPLLLCAPIVWLTLHLLDRARSRRLARVAGPRVASLAADVRGRRRELRRALFAAGLLLAAVAVMRPVWGESANAATPRGADVVLCLDVSRSMLARDEAPSRLERAKREIAELAARARGDRLGLVVFAGEARLLVPLTRDVDAFDELAGSADPTSVRRGGTDLGAALDAALAALKGSTGDDRAIVLVTDGEDLGGRGFAAAARCREARVTVHCVAFGTALGSKIAVEGKSGEEFVRDRAGGEVVSAADRTGLARIAETTGGAFVDAHESRRPLGDLYDGRILPAARGAFETERRRARESRFQWPLAAAFAFWILELCLKDRRP